MKKIGIIGGAGPLASSLLYESIIRGCYEAKVTVPEMFILNFPFTRILTEKEKQSSSSIVTEELAYCVQCLERCGAEIGLLACNTLHLVLKQLPTSIVKFHALPDLVLKEAVEDNANALLFLGTQNSRLSGLYQRSPIRIVYPSTSDQRNIDDIIDRVLEGSLLEADSLLIGQMIERAVLENTIEGVVLGCSDLPVLHHHYPVKSNVKIYDSIKLPAERIRRML